MSEFNKVESTGKDNREFETGSVRDSAEGKGRQDLIPMYPLKRLARHYENGAKKYGDRNWEKGQPLTAFFSSGFRHWTEFWDGENSEDHLSATVWNAFGMIHTIREIVEGRLPTSLLDGMPEKVQWVILNDRQAYLAGQKLNEMGTEIKDALDKEYLTKTKKKPKEEELFQIYSVAPPPPKKKTALCDCTACTRARNSGKENNDK
jgi:hypothetical protein